MILLTGSAPSPGGKPHAFGADDIVTHFLPAGKVLFQIVFSVWVDFGERKWVTLA